MHHERRNRHLRRGDSSLISGAPFKILICLLALALVASILLFSRLEAVIISHDVNNLGIIRHLPTQRYHRDEDDEPPNNKARPPHLHPRLPHLPPFPIIADEDVLIHQTLYENKPTIAGIAAILYRHLNALHESNRRMSQNLSSQPKKGGPNAREREASAVRDAYFDLVRDDLKELEDARRGGPMFSIREDESVFVSVASFREHLLGETLMSAFDRAARPDRLFVGVIVNNCFGTDERDFPCTGTAHVVGKDKNGMDILESVDGTPDVNHIETFCGNATYRKYCDEGQVRVLYVHEADALGPAVARYYASKLWGGETHFMQVDSHLRFAHRWDELLVEDLRLATSYPRAVLSTYPPGFVNFEPDPPYVPGTKLCRCRMRIDEDFLPRVELRGRSNENETRPSKTPFMGAGFFFARAEFLVDVPFDPYLAWMFMGEEIALSVRAWTHGWDLYAPRRNLVGHQYRPLQMGNPHFWDIWHKFYHRPKLMDRLSPTTHERIKVMMGYREFQLTSASNYSVVELSHYGLGTHRSKEEYLEFAEIDLENRKCGKLKWCAEGTLQ
ncbi:hypothetical protein ACHAWF_002458 [Thalassiosira exigua]